MVILEEEIFLKKSYLLSGQKNFNKMFRKNVIYDDIESYIKAELQPHSEK